MFLINCTRLLNGAVSLAHVNRHNGADPRAIPREMLRYCDIPAPMVVWNITRGCNLACKHCYINATPVAAEGELTTGEAKAFIRDMAEMRVPMLVLSGGEPLWRKDVFELAAYARSAGLDVILSSNGTLITEEVAERCKESGFSYVGVSIDGWAEVHDRFRGRNGAFARTVSGIRNLLKTGIRVGMRITVTRHNRDDLKKVIDLAVREGVPRLSIFQLVYAGRGRAMIDWDIEREQRRELIRFIIENVADLKERGAQVEIITADNYADGVYLFNYLKERDPGRAEEVKQLLGRQSGCTAGERLLDVDPAGNVHPCPYWQHLSLGNVRERKLSEIWFDAGSDFLRAMRDKTRYLKGKCSRCRLNHICGGCRVRAEVASGDPLAEDPACYLTEAEIS